LTLTLFADGVENPANLERLKDAARLLGGTCGPIHGRLLAIENAAGARSIYGRAPLRGSATIALGNERHGLSRATLASADETLEIPTQSRTVTTLNVAAAAAVAGWYALKGSGPQARAARPDHRRPALLIVGDDHVEIGSSLRSAAALGFRDVMLHDRGAAWFGGTSGQRREARAAARRYKNPLRIHRASLEDAAAFEEIIVVRHSGGDAPLQRANLARGARQLIIVGANPEEVARASQGRARVASLRIEPVDRPPLRLVASIVLAEVARQVGRRRPAIAGPRAPRFDSVVRLMPADQVSEIDAERLLEF
jgi:hypothetical protein